MKQFFKSILTTTIGVILGTVVCLVLIPIIFFAFLKGAQKAKHEAVVKHSILHVKLNGAIVEKHHPLDFELLGDRSIFSEDRTMGLYELDKAIDMAKTDSRIDGIYLEIRNVDAGWATATALRNHLEDFAKSGKWIYAYGERMNEMSFYIASAATETYLQPNGEIEFNGLATSEPFLKGLLTKLDVEARVFRVGRFKAAVEPLILEGMSKENREQNKVLLDDVWSTFRTTVAKTTKLSPEKIDSIANSLSVTSAEDAVNAGLIKATIFEDDLEDKLRLKTVGKDEDLELVTPGLMLKEGKPVRKKTGGNKIAVIFAEGEINAGSGGRDSIGSESLRQDIIDAKEDDDVQAIVLRVNSPGGDALASDVIWRELRITDDEIPVVISMGEVAASGGYYISSASRYIFAEPTTITGSIGVFGLMFDTGKFFKNKAGVNFDKVVTHQYADIGDANQPMSKAEGDSIQHDVERVYKRFLDVVAEGRGYEKRSDLEAIAEGRVWSGTRAKELGLVDELGGLDQAIAKAADFAELGKDYDVEIFPEDRDALTTLVERFAGDSVKSMIGVSNFSHLQEITKQPFKNGIYTLMPFDLKFH